MGRYRTTLALGAVAVVAGGAVVYAGLVGTGEMTPPPVVPRHNERFSTLTWSQSHLGGSRSFRTITVHAGGTFVERFAQPRPGRSPTPRARRGKIPAATFDTIKGLATSAKLAAEDRRLERQEGGCTDMSEIGVRMGEFRVLSECDTSFDEAPTFARLSDAVEGLGSDVRPPGGA